MNKYVSLFFYSLLAACSKDSSIAPPQVLSCSPNPNLEAIWISDSTRIMETDSNLIVLFDATHSDSFPTWYCKFNFTCQNSKPTFSAENFQNSSAYVMHDTADYHLYGNIIYFGSGTVTDTALMDKKYIDYFSGNILHLRYTTINPATLTRQDEYFYLHK